MPVGKAGLLRGFAAVGHYIQGPDAICQLPMAARRLGQRGLMLIGSHFYDREVSRLRALFDGSGVEMELELFRGSGTREELDDLVRRLAGRPNPPQMLAALGGGKSLDTARVAAGELGVPMILCPTSAATNAPTSGLSVIYDGQGTGRTVYLCRNPEYIIADTRYILQGTPRMLAAGMGDALATYFEARNNWRTDNINTVMPGYRPTLCGKHIARACLDTLLERGERAMLAAEQGLDTQDFEDVVEAIFLLSGLGWENNGCSIAHALSPALERAEETKGVMHGECVAFCLLVQLLMDREEVSLFDRVYRLCRSLGLPVCLEQLGIREDRERRVREIVDLAFSLKDTLEVANYPVTPEGVCRNILLLDALAQKER